MNILIIGENTYNSYINEYFTQKGIDVFLVPDVYKLRSVTGEIGNFNAGIKENKGIEDIHYSQIDSIILTEQPLDIPVVIEGLSASPLYDNKEYELSAVTSALEPVVFLLDYVCESPISATITALNDAVVFARRKRKVYYLSRFIRTSGFGIEVLYRDARDAGVTFLKYENIQITSNADEEFFINVSGGGVDLEIKTSILFAHGSREAGERFLYAVKKLNLTLNKHGYLTEDTFYLTPVLTSRRGVFYITRDIITERLDEGLEYIYSLLTGKVKIADLPAAHSPGTAVIDAKKCIFCYNCYRACPHAALEPNHTESCMQCLPAACVGCGICAGLCPASAIELDNDVKYIDDTPGKTLVIYCENSGGAAVESTEDIITLAVPCGGSIDTVLHYGHLHLYDKIMSVVCPDEACRHFNGNKRACAQVKRLQSMLDAAGLTPERLKTKQVSHAMPVVMQDELKGLSHL